MLKLDNDTLLLIFEKLKDDNNSLFSCLLVNRQWCKMTIPILWRDPMKNKFNGQLLDIIKLSLSDKSRKFLLSNEIDLNMNLQLRQKPLFDYIKYCKYLRFNHFNEYANLATTSVKEEDYFLIEQEFFKLYISKCSAIKYLNLKLTERYYQASHDLKNYQLCKFPGAINCFSELSELHCDSYIDSSIFYGFAETCKFIQKINVYQLYDNPGLIKLIKVQINLKKFKYTASKFVKHKMKEFNEIGKALEENAETLIHFKAVEDLYGNGFIPTIFPKFKNLEKLILFRLCYCNMQYELEEQLAITTFPKLKVLHIQDASISTVRKIIEKTEGNLSKIAIYDVECTKDCGNNPFQGLIRSIYQNCPDLKFLRLEIKDDVLEEFEKLLITCQQLEGLVIESCRWEHHIIETKNLLKLLAKSAPNNLSKFKFYYNWKFTKDSLISFFESWRGKKPLQFYMVGMGKFLSIFEKYKNERIIERYEDIEEIYFKCFEW